MLPKPMRDLDAEEAKWFIELDETPATKDEIDQARRSIDVFNKIKPKK
ncbi:MAG: hypothetical protein NWF07_14920 [Candidatus Bathyarchaeota archaeon]|nr:hypothetical protein [Candidatus Bathyarchaeota archaeon]